MKELILALSKVQANTDTLKIAKGILYLPKGFKDLHRINKQLNGYG